MVREGLLKGAMEGTGCVWAGWECGCAGPLVGSRNGCQQLRGLNREHGVFQAPLERLV